MNKLKLAVAVVLGLVVGQAANLVAVMTWPGALNVPSQIGLAAAVTGLVSGVLTHLMSRPDAR